MIVKEILELLLLLLGNILFQKALEAYVAEQVRDYDHEKQIKDLALTHSVSFVLRHDIA